MIIVKLLILAGIGAIIGWVTNLLAIKLLFRPIEPVNIPLVNFNIQGLIPKRRGEIAKSIGQAVEEELLSIEDVLIEFIERQDTREICEVIKSKAGKIISDRLPGIIPSLFKGSIKKYIDDIIDKEGSKMIAEITESMIHKASSSIQVGKMVEERINGFPLDKLEEVVFSIAKKELKHIEILGAVLGFVIGLLQGLIIILL